MLMDRPRLNTLMDQASHGDADAFGTLAAEVQDELYRVARALGLGRDDAAEVTQEALLRVYSARPRWKPGSDTLAWICGITLNVAREYRRRDHRRWLGFAGQKQRPVALVQAREADDESDDARRRLVDAIAQLPDRQREAIACRYLRRMSIAETAAAMGCQEGTVKSTVASALEKLRRILELQP
jgi:RNA polymerase sigma factor (sigma-70 family)